jgi:hypothetical protein
MIGTYPVGAGELRKFEIRRPAPNAPGKLIAYVGDREVILSTDALQAWPGWYEDVLIYSEQRPDGKYELRSFNAITGAQRKITVERRKVEDITVARLANGEHTIVLFLRDSSGTDPSLALAHPVDGVFRRVPHATASAIVNDTVVLHIFRPLTRSTRTGDASHSEPVRVATIPLGRHSRGQR